jgi:hypothetical protein
VEVYDTYEHEGVGVEIHYDMDPMSPREWDNATTMVSLAPRYNSPDDPQFPNEREAYERGSYALLERYLRVACGVVAFDQWSAGMDNWGYAYITRERADELGMTERYEDALNAETCEYAQWVEGQVYGYVVDPCGPDEDSCWGFIGDPDYAKQEANAMAHWVSVERAKRQQRRGRPLHHATLVQVQS